MESKKLKFTKLRISNFRNIVESELDFKEGFNEISAKNGVGKTNTLSAIMWCLFGKDINDVKQFVISPIIDGKEDNSIETIVTLIINDNYVVQRKYKNRVTTLKTGWIIDGKEELVELTQTKYKEELTQNFVDEETFKSLSNITYVPSLNWKELKALIFELIGEIDDNEVLLLDNFDKIEEYVKKFGISQTEKQLKETDSTLKSEIKTCETTYQTLLNTRDKYVVLDKKESEELTSKKEQIEKQLYQNNQEIAERDKLLTDKNNKISEVNNLKNVKENLENKKQNNIEMIETLKKTYDNSGFNVEIQRENDLTEQQYKIDSVKNDIDKLISSANDLEKAKEEIKKQATELSTKEIKVENDICPTCGNKMPEEHIRETIQKLEKEKQEKIDDLRNNFNSIDNQLNIIKETIKDKKDLLDHEETTLELIKTKEYEVVVETDKQIEIKNTIQAYKSTNEGIEKQIKNIEENISKLEKEIENIQINDVNVDNDELKKQLNEINEKLATTIAFNKITEDVDNAKLELENKKENYVKNKEKLEEVVKFNNVKAEILKKRVKTYFDLVTFKTQEFNKDGQEVETFKICNSKGVEYDETNTGQRILLGIDLVCGIMRAKNIYVPIIVDNFEALTDNIETDNQIIVARAVKDIDRIEVK